MASTKRLGLLLALMLLLASLIPGSALAKKPVTDAYSATLSQNRCTFSFVGTWPSNVAIDNATGWIEEDGAFWATPVFTADVAARTVTTSFVPAAATSRHSWEVVVQFYNGSAAVSELRSNTVTARCG